MQSQIFSDHFVLPKIRFSVCNHCLWLVPVCFHHPKRNPRPQAVTPHFLLPHPQANSSLIYPFWMFHINVILQHVALCVWFHPCCIAYISSWTPVYGNNHILYIHLLMDIWVVFFLTTVNSASINISVQIFVWNLFSVLCVNT